MRCRVASNLPKNSTYSHHFLLRTEAVGEGALVSFVAGRRRRRHRRRLDGHWRSHLVGGRRCKRETRLGMSNDCGHTLSPPSYRRDRFFSPIITIYSLRTHDRSLARSLARSQGSPLFSRRRQLSVLSDGRSLALDGASVRARPTAFPPTPTRNREKNKAGGRGMGRAECREGHPKAAGS